MQPAARVLLLLHRGDGVTLGLGCNNVLPPQRVGEGHQPLAADRNEAGPPDSRRLRGGAARAGRTPQVFTKCGNQYPEEQASGGAMQRAAASGMGGGGVAGGREISAVNVSSYGWVYTW